MEQAMTAPVMGGQATIVRSVDAVGRWALDPERTSVRFAVPKLWGLTTVTGVFHAVEGHVDIDDDGGFTAVLELDAGSVDTANARRDRHLRSPDFFDVERHPRMRVDIDTVELSGSDHGVARGSVTILGRAIPLAFEVDIALPSGAGSALVTATATIDRLGAGVGRRMLGLVGAAVVVDARLAYRWVAG